MLKTLNNFIDLFSIHSQHAKIYFSLLIKIKKRSIFILFQNNLNLILINTEIFNCFSFDL